MKYGGPVESRIPDVEVLVQAAQSDVALVAFYMPSDIHADVEVVAYISDHAELGSVRTVLQLAVQALYQQGWLTVDELDANPVEKEAGSPFQVKNEPSNKGA